MELSRADRVQIRNCDHLEASWKERMITKLTVCLKELEARKCGQCRKGEPTVPGEVFCQDSLGAQSTAFGCTKFERKDKVKEADDAAH